MADLCIPELCKFHDHVLGKICILCIGAVTRVIATTGKDVAWQRWQDYTGDILSCNQNWENGAIGFFLTFLGGLLQFSRPSEIALEFL
jgi:hypothetical protein